MSLIAVTLAVLATLGDANAPDGSAPPKVDRVYRNPIIDIIGPADPSVIQCGGLFYLYPTWDGKGYDVFTSPDLVQWEHRGKCFNAPQGGAWAPDVFHYVRGDGKFYLYYTVNAPERKKQVGVAVAENPLGPFEDKGVLVTEAIDAHMFQSTDGAFYLYYVQVSMAGNQIWVQPMADPLHKKDDPQKLIFSVEPWEKHGPITEGPWMLQRGDTYYLMYSGSAADGPDYAIGYATSKSPMGPFVKYPGNPIAKRGDGVFGPGHHCVVEGPRGDLWMVYHQKVDEGVNWKRFLAIDPLWFDREGVIHTKVSRGAFQPAP